MTNEHFTTLHATLLERLQAHTAGTVHADVVQALSLLQPYQNYLLDSERAEVRAWRQHEGLSRWLEVRLTLVPRLQQRDGQPAPLTSPASTTHHEQALAWFVHASQQPELTQQLTAPGLVFVQGSRCQRQEQREVLGAMGYQNQSRGETVSLCYFSPYSDGYQLRVELSLMMNITEDVPSPTV